MTKALSVDKKTKNNLLLLSVVLVAGAVVAIFSFNRIFISLFLNLLLLAVLFWFQRRVRLEIEEEHQYLKEFDASAKMLVQKDRKLVFANAELRRLNEELDKAAKELVKRDLELTEANARLRELDNVKSEFIMVAAHQLRTPLTGIRWAFNMLEEEELGKLTPQQKEIIDNGSKATVRIINLIEDLLNVSRFEEGRFGFKFGPKSIIPILESIQPQFQKIAAEKAVKLSFSWAKAFSYLINLDEERIAAVFNMLLDNAIRYTTPGGEVGLTVSVEGLAVKVEIKDTGIGIPRDQQHKVFTKFFRAANALVNQTEGNGLSLYLAKNIITKHGGAISVQSVENKGTTVTVTLPISR